LSEYKFNHCFCTNGRTSKNESVTNNFVVFFLIIKKIFFFNLKQLNQTFNNLEVVNLKTFLSIVSSFKSISTNLSSKTLFYINIIIELFNEILEIFMISLSILELVFSAMRGFLLNNPSPKYISLLSESIEIVPIIENPFYVTLSLTMFVA